MKTLIAVTRKIEEKDYRDGLLVSGFTFTSWVQILIITILSPQFYD